MSDDQADELGGEWHPLARLACLQVAEQLEAAGFVLRPPGYWSFEVNGIELTLEPLTFGRFDLSLYVGRMLILPGKLRVTVEPARGSSGGE